MVITFTSVTWVDKVTIDILDLRYEIRDIRAHQFALPEESRAPFL